MIQTLVDNFASQAHALLMVLLCRYIYIYISTNSRFAIMLTVSVSILSILLEPFKVLILSCFDPWKLHCH